MINSKQLIELTDISRATLNNYVALGILPNPIIKTPSNNEGRATRLGYFDDNAIEIINQVKYLKKSGYSIAEIAEQMSSDKVAPDSNRTSRVTASSYNQNAPVESGKMRLPEFALEQSIESFPGPAYMVNNNFELIWWNQPASGLFVDDDQEMPGDLESRNLINLLFNIQKNDDPETLKDILQPHLAAAKKRLSQQSLIKIYSGLQPDQLNLLKTLHEEVDPIGKQPIVHYPSILPEPDGETALFDLYVCFYREGILFTYSPVELEDDFLMDFLSKRNQVVNELLKKRKPSLTHVTVMVADLQSSTRICSELPAEEYFELINSIWQKSEPIFRKYYGTYGKHAGDGMVYYFFPQPDCDYRINAIQCSLELKNMMAEITKKWQSRKGWFSELHLNIGLNEGQEWFGSFHAGGHIEFTVLGETINYASRVSDFAREGSIWATKSMLNQLTPENRKQVNYGISRRTRYDETVFVTESYASLGSLLDEEHQHNRKFRDVEMLPVTEIRDISPIT